MRIVIDVNLPNEWIRLLNHHGHDALSWRDVGRRDAPDSEIMAWAVDQRRIVFTADLDFGEAVTISKASGPSIIQLRAGSTNPDHVGEFVMSELDQASAALLAGAILTIEPGRSRTRHLFHSRE